MFYHPSAQTTPLIRFPSPKLALEYIKGLDKNADAMAVDVPSDTGAVPAEALYPLDTDSNLTINSKFLQRVKTLLPPVSPIRAAASPQLQASHYIAGSRTHHTCHHCATMSDGPGYHNRQPAIATKICSLLSYLNPSTYDEIAPKIEYWIEYVITEQFTTIDDLVKRVSSVAWGAGCYSSISRFLKEFHDAPHRSELMRSFVEQLCTHVLRWFTIAAVEDLPESHLGSSVASGGWSGFVCAASFVGHLIECGLLSHDLVRRHLVKPLITHHGYDHCRARAIYELFVVPGNALLQGLLEPGDVQVCFERLDTLGDTILQGRHRTQLYVCFQILEALGGPRVSDTPDRGAGLYVAKLNVRRGSRIDASHYDLTCTTGTSRDTCCVVIARGGGRAKSCRGN
jgi:hypothetical protein